MEKKYDVLVPIEQLNRFMKDAAMNRQYGIQVFFSLDPKKAQALLPPPLKITEPSVGYLYIVNIREPTFGPWYMEGGLGIMAQMGDVTGLHFLGLQLSGPGALTGMCTGRETSGLPKKLCECIHVERVGDEGHCYIERHGVRLVDVKLQMGQYNQPEVMHTIAGAQEGCSAEHPVDTEGACILFRYQLDNGFKNMVMTYYDSLTRYQQWDPATAEVTFASTEDDPWAALPVTGVLGAGWMVSDNWVRSQHTLHEYAKEETDTVMQYLFRGRFDQCTLCNEHQIYE